jgi:hypothetical protein
VSERMDVCAAGNTATAPQYTSTPVRFPSSQGCLQGRCSVSSLPWSPAGFSTASSTKQCPAPCIPVSPWEHNLTQDQHLIDLLNKLQSSRLDDQRCTMPGPNTSHAPWSASRQRLESVLRSSPPYPMVVLPPEGGFWVDPSVQRYHDSSYDSDGNPVIGDLRLVGEHDDSPCRTYRAHFLQSEHFNFCGLEDNIGGPMVLSVKYYNDSESQESSNHIRVILRLTSGTMHKLLASDGLPEQPSPILLARMVAPDVSVSTLQPVLCPRASELLLNFDE